MVLDRIPSAFVLAACVASSACQGDAATEASYTCEPAADLPAFPGAEGFGASATGGRCGEVITVTTLAPQGPGSLQAALARFGPRIVVFAVSGLIEGNIEITHGDMTIAGESAPGGGVTIAGRLAGRWSPEVDNIIVRHLRIRPQYQGLVPGEEFDALQLTYNRRVMLDHVSVSGGVDESVDLFQAQDVTLQWSTITKSAVEGHPEGRHNFGLIQGPEGRRVSIHHNLFAHHENRAPALATGPAEVVDNVIYDVRTAFVHNNPAEGRFNVVGNSYIRGPESALVPFMFDDEASGAASSLAYHLRDNFIDDPGVFVGTVDDPWSSNDHPSFSDLRLDAGFYRAAPFDFAALHGRPIEVHASDVARAMVLREAGASPRDDTLRQVVDEVEARDGGWGEPAPAVLPASPPSAPDGDGDGMPDRWERARGLDPADGGDHVVVLSSGYTAIETYLHERAAERLNEAAP